ncbi:MAG: ATP-binding cassette domain-containing protein [Candidatus Helarchaeota archaeon]|nr:ATP-binding cassette domain-containing protein [Candidatus Helarchaeota archaeon]
MIELKNLSKKFKETVAVNDISLKIKNNEIFGLLGPNGAGKTTILLILVTVLRPTSGTAIINGFDVLSHPNEVRKQIGICFQDVKLDWALSYKDILNWHGKVCGLSKEVREKRIAELTKKLRLEEAGKKSVWKLSGGMRKKVEVSKILLQRPKVAIFDEPTSNLDPEMKNIIWDYIKAMRDEYGSTVLLATNQMEEADELCKNDRVAIINEGKLVTIDSPKKLKDSIPGGDIIEVKTNESAKSIREQLLNLDQVVDVQLTDNVAHIYLNQSEKIAPYILQIFIENKFIINKFKMSEPSLEEVFFKYTKRSLL